MSLVIPSATWCIIVLLPMDPGYAPHDYG